MNDYLEIQVNKFMKGLSIEILNYIWISELNQCNTISL